MTDSDIIKGHAAREYAHAMSRVAVAVSFPSPDNYRDAAEALRQVASRYDSLSEIEQARADHPSVSSLPSEPKRPPTVDEFCGHDPNFTEGLTTEEYMESIRGRRTDACHCICHGNTDSRVLCAHCTHPLPSEPTGVQS